MNNLPVDAKYRTRPNRAHKSTASLGIQVEVIWDLTYPGHYSSVDMTSVCGQEAGRAGGSLSLNSDMGACRRLPCSPREGGKWAQMFKEIPIFLRTD